MRVKSKTKEFSSVLSYLIQKDFFLHKVRTGAAGFLLKLVVRRQQQRLLRVGDFRHLGQDALGRADDRYLRVHRRCRRRRRIRRLADGVVGADLAVRIVPGMSAA